MIKVEEEGRIDSAIEGRGERGTLACVFEVFILRCKGDMESNNRRNVFAHNESLKLLSTIPLSTKVTYLFFTIVLSKLFLCVYIQDGGYRLCEVCRLACSHLGFAM